MPTNFEECIVVARSELKIARQSLNQEISTYPTPISGCDAQFNYLLAERERVRTALQTLDQSFFVPTPRSPTASTGVESR
jgi:hypothetical protein